MEQIPILKVGRCLLVSIQFDMHDKLAMALQEDLTQKLVESRARGVMIDISALDLVDSFIGRMLSNIAAMARVLDAQTVLVGMRPQVAITRTAIPQGLAPKNGIEGNARTDDEHPPPRGDSADVGEDQDREQHRVLHC